MTISSKDLVAIFEYMEREKGIKRSVVAEAIEESLRIAARQTIADTEEIQVSINSKTGQVQVLLPKEVVNEVEDPNTEIELEEAQEINSEAQVGDILSVEVTPENFGRIAAQKAKQVITMKLRTAERDVIYSEYRDRVGEIVSGTVKRFARGNNLIVDLGKVEALMPMREYPKTESYQIGDKVVAVLLEVQDTPNGGAEVILSRSSPEFVKELFAQEVPEIAEGTIQIDRIAREPGYRTKLCVSSNDPRLDPVGACVGMRGIRVKNIIRELENEKVDILPSSNDLVETLQLALDPIVIKKVKVDEEAEHPQISIVVDDDSYPAVLGKKGMNARLCGRLIGMELIVHKESHYQKNLSLERGELSLSEDKNLDEPLQLEGMSSMLVDNLVEAGFDTYRKVIAATPETLAEVPGFSLEIADRILEQTTNRVKSFGQESQA